jgi:hypothetical protein
MSTLYQLLAQTNLNIESIIEKCSTCNKHVALNLFIKSYGHCNCDKPQIEILYEIQSFDKLMSYSEAVRNLEYFIKVNGD